MDKQIKQPQDIIIPQSESNKSAEAISLTECKDRAKARLGYSNSVEYLEMTRSQYDEVISKAFEISTHSLNSRITQLEAGLKQCQSDRDELQEANDKLEKQNIELREALEEVKKVMINTILNGMHTEPYKIAEQALNPKDK